MGHRVGGGQRGPRGLGATPGVPLVGDRPADAAVGAAQAERRGLRGRSRGWMRAGAGPPRAEGEPLGPHDPGHLRGKGTAKIYTGTPSLGWRCPEAIRVRGQVTVAPTRAAPVVRTKVTWKVLPREARWARCVRALSGGSSGAQGRRREAVCGYRPWRMGRRPAARSTAQRGGAGRPESPRGRL